MADKQNVIEVNKLSKIFNNRLMVTDVTMNVRRGEILGFIGPNGAGKTTTIRMLCGLIEPTTGSGHCVGFDLMKEAHQIRLHIGYMPQNFSLYNDLTVYENLVFRARLFGLIDQQLAIKKIIDLLGLAKYQNQISGTLSGGWRQRVSLGAALINKPRVLLLDEPTVGLDADFIQIFWRIISELAERGTTVLLSSHNMDDIGRCHRLAYLGTGKILKLGSITEIIQSVGLVTQKVTGPNLALLAKQLNVFKSKIQITHGLNRLHVAALDESFLETAIKPYITNPNFVWQKISPNLEDSFIWLTTHTEDTRHGH